MPRAQIEPFQARGHRRVGLQVIVEARDFALETAFVAPQLVESVVRSAVGLVGPRHELGLAILVVAFGERPHAQAQIEVAGFEEGDAAETILSDGDAFDEIFLGLAVGAQVGEVGIAEGLEVGGVFVRQEGRFTGEGVDGAVAAGFGFTFGGAGASGFLRVGAICFDLRLTGHRVLPISG